VRDMIDVWDVHEDYDGGRQNDILNLEVRMVNLRNKAFVGY